VSHKTITDLVDVMFSEITHGVTQATELNRTHGSIWGSRQVSSGEAGKIFLTSDIRRNFRRCLPAGSTLQNRFQTYVLCDRRSEVRKLERWLFLGNSSTVKSIY